MKNLLSSQNKILNVHIALLMYNVGKDGLKSQ